MVSQSIASQPAWLHGLRSWARERFPAEHVVSGAVIFFVAFFSAKSLRGFPSGPDRIGISPADFLGALAMICHFLFLRILDEHKDFEVDRINHPERALQRGLISLDQLKLLGALAVLVEVLATLAVPRSPGVACLAWAAMMGWTLLMAKEFFCGEWLRQRLALYSVSHMLVMPLMVVWAIELSAPGISLPSTLPVLALAFASGLAFEVTRKTRGREEEKDGLDSFSKALGVGGAAFAIALLCAAIFGSQIWVVRELGGFEVGYLAASLGWVASLASVARFSRRPTSRGRKLNEAVVGLFLLSSYANVIACAIIRHGIGWSG